MARAYRWLDGKAVRKYAAEKNLSLRSLARGLCVEWGKFWKWLDGKQQMPQHKIDELADLLDVPAAVLKRYASGQRKQIQNMHNQMQVIVGLEPLLGISEYINQWTEAAHWLMPTMDMRVRNPDADVNEKHRRLYLGQIVRVELANLANQIGVEAFVKRFNNFPPETQRYFAKLLREVS